HDLLLRPRREGRGPRARAARRRARNARVAGHVASLLLGELHSVRRRVDALRRARPPRPSTEGRERALRKARATRMRLLRGPRNRRGFSLAARDSLDGVRASPKVTFHTRKSGKSEKCAQASPPFRCQALPHETFARPCGVVDRSAEIRAGIAKREC